MPALPACRLQGHTPCQSERGTFPLYRAQKNRAAQHRCSPADIDNFKIDVRVLRLKIPSYSPQRRCRPDRNARTDCTSMPVKAHPPARDGCPRHGSPILLPAAGSRGSGRGSRSQPRHGQALRQLLRQGQAQGPPTVQSHGQHSADAQLGPSRLLRQGPQAQEKG